jgi:hypothetical protein
MIVIPVLKPNRQGGNDMRSIYVLQAAAIGAAVCHAIPPSLPILR